jgi:hypothetical protein
VFDEFVFPYYTTTPPSSDLDLDLFTLLPTDVVVEPPILPLSAGTRSPPVGPTTGPGPVVSPLRGAPSPIAPGPSGSGGTALPVGLSVPTPPARFARLPAPAAAAGVRTSTVATTAAVPTSDLSSSGTADGPVPARDTYTSVAAIRGTCRDAGVPPTTSSPQPVACPPDGDAARGWYPAAPSPSGHD